MGSKLLDWPLRKRPVGFEDNLVLKELLLLGAFRQSKSIAWPADTGLTESETKALLESLRRKNLICGRAPYTLTNKGKKIVADYYQHLLAKYESSADAAQPISGNAETSVCSPVRESVDLG
jgi:hypothetical protein